MSGALGTARRARLLKPRADVTAVVDACYAPATDLVAWSRDVLDALGLTLEVEPNLGLVAIEHDPSFTTGTYLVVVAPPGGLGAFEPSRLWDDLGIEAVRRYFYPRDIVTTHARVERGIAASVRGRMRDYRRSMGMDTPFGMVVHPDPRVALVVFGNLPPGVELSRHERARLAQIALHVESGFRLRRRASRVRAVVRGDGVWIEGDVGPASRERLAASARAVDAARSRHDLDPWTALVAGEVSVVPRLRGSRRVYEIIENAHAARPFRALTGREIDVLRIAARGASTKLCGYALGLSPAAISNTLAAAAAKVGAASRLELVRVAALLLGDPRSESDEVTLTRAEREILALVADGLSNAAIAARRGRSVHTIAKQVASLLHKTGSDSRRALVLKA
ncbi:MAG TPA: helix-turn-helix transcriptional regulator [Minicystis sp.]|nr:helix-turn-helix transcriptional regulator [Minicystis sp.]